MKNGECMTDDTPSFMDEDAVKRTIKASVFTDLFSHPKYACQLYHVFHPDDTDITEDSIQNVNIQNVLTTGIYNDLGFIAGNHALLLMEAQSTWSRHIIFREVAYLFQTYIEIINENEYSLFGDKKFTLPVPEMYVLYTGDKKEVPSQLNFIDTYFNGAENVNRLNFIIPIFRSGITDGDILCQYKEFCDITKHHFNTFGYTRKAINDAILLCIHNNILKEYLTNKKREVVSMMMALFDQATAVNMYAAEQKREGIEEGKREGKREGIEEGKKEGIEEGIQNAIYMLKNLDFSYNDAINEIVKFYNISLNDAKAKFSLYWK